MRDPLGVVQCRCEPVPCELSTAPICDGPCPDPTQVCFFVDSLNACRCLPSDVVCDLSPYPACDGDCPPGTVCVPDPLGSERCLCEPIPCEQSFFPICDGDCPPGTVCVEDPAGDDQCVCQPLIACDETFFPACDGACPPLEQCVNVAGTDNCRCEPIPDPLCRDSLFPLCDGFCPPDERCTPGDPGAPCQCLPCRVVVPDDDIEIFFSSKTLLEWTGGTCAVTFNVYRAILPRPVDGDLDGLADDYGSCFLFGLALPQATDLTSPGMGMMHTYLVTGKNPAGEGSLGYTSALLERPNLAPCP
jgi:hypothetical protein